MQAFTFCQIKLKSQYISRQRLRFFNAFKPKL